MKYIAIGRFIGFWEDGEVFQIKSAYDSGWKTNTDCAESKYNK